MLRTRSHWLVAALIASSVLTATVVQAQTQPQPPAPGGGRMYDRLQTKLGLTDDQVNQIRTVFQAQRDARRQLWQSLRQAQGNLRQLAVTGGEANALATAKAQVAQLLAQGVDLRVQTLQQIAPILTPDQRTQFAQMDPGAMWRRHHRGPKPPQS